MDENMQGLVECEYHLYLYLYLRHHILMDETMQGLVECEYQFRNDRWNCTDNRDTARIQTTLERGICINVDLMRMIVMN